MESLCTLEVHSNQRYFLCFYSSSSISASQTKSINLTPFVVKEGHKEGILKLWWPLGKHLGYYARKKIVECPCWERPSEQERIEERTKYQMDFSPTITFS